MTSTSDRLSSNQLGRVLDTLAVSLPPQPTLVGLAGIDSAWCRSVPFDNTRKLIHIGTRHSGALPGDEQRRRVLIEEIGIHPELVEQVPADRSTPPIPTSRTAAG